MERHPLAEHWENDTNPVGTDGKPTYKKPLKIQDDRGKSLEEIFAEINKKHNTDDIEEV